MNEQQQEPPLTTPFDLSRRAVEQATDVIGRLLHAFDPRPGTEALDRAVAPQSDGDATIAQMRATVGRAVDLYLDLFQRTFDVYVESVERALRRRGTSVSGPSGAEALVLAASSGGPAARGQLFLHNDSGQAIGPVTALLTDLTAADGATIGADRARIEPQRIERVEDRSSSPITVELDVDAALPGTYHGHVFVADSALAVRVEVR